MVDLPPQFAGIKTPADVAGYHLVNLCNWDSDISKVLFEIGCIKLIFAFPQGIKPKRICLLKGFSIGSLGEKEFPFSDITLNSSPNLSNMENNELVLSIVYAAPIGGPTSLNIENIAQESERYKEKVVDLSTDTDLAKKIIALVDMAYLIECFPLDDSNPIKATFWMKLNEAKSNFVVGLKIDPNESIFDHNAAIWTTKLGHKILWRQEKSL